MDIFNRRFLQLLIALSIVVMCGLLISCSHKPATAPVKQTAKSDVTLYVHAGAALQPALDEAAEEFTKKTGVKIQYNYKGSACLLPDVCTSKTGDAYIPGEQYFLVQGVERKVVKPGAKNVATMTTVLVTQAGNPKKIQTLADLAKPGMKLGLGDPEVVAIGRAARECLVKAGVWGQAQKNITMGGQNVSEISNAVKLKHVDAAIIWDATAALYNEKEMHVIPLPPMTSVCSPVPVGIVTYTKHEPEVKQFIDFLTSTEGLTIFKKHGFDAPPDTICPPGREGKQPK